MPNIVNTRRRSARARHHRRAEEAIKWRHLWTRIGRDVAVAAPGRFSPFLALVAIVIERRTPTPIANKEPTPMQNIVKFAKTAIAPATLVILASLAVAADAPKENKGFAA